MERVEKMRVGLKFWKMETVQILEVKQIASARFGVTVNYLNNCNEIEIKNSSRSKNQEKVVNYLGLKLQMRLQN